MLASAEVYAQNNQATIITPFILAGAMAPSTSAGVAAQTLAEALAGMTFVQLVRPGAPVVFGSFASSMSMQSGAPTFGTPEPALVLYAVAAGPPARCAVPVGRLAHRLEAPDAQAAYESAATLIPTMMAGTNFVLHAAGWLEGGPRDRLREVRARRRSIGDDGDVRTGPRHVRERSGARRHPREPARPALPGHGPHARQLRVGVLPLDTADNSSFEQWLEDGGLDAAQRASRLWRSLDAYEPPTIDDAIDAELVEFVNRRKAELLDTFA